MKNRRFIVRVSGCAVLFVSAAVAFSAARPEPPDFKEVFDLVGKNAAGITEEELNRAAVEGLLGRLNGRAWIREAEAAPDTNTATLSSSAVFDDHYGYLRISRVGTGLAGQFDKALAGISATNRLRGMVLDLRFANGQDYAAAAAVADRFLTSGQKLLEWSGGSATSREKTDAFRSPVAVLINHSTAGAAEALAAVLRAADVALLIGTNTAGLASTTKDFPLSNGQVLRVAAAPVRLGNGDAVTALKPDIIVEVNPEEEQAYFADAYKVLPRPGAELSGTNTASLTITNRNPRRRINEAELVRMLREGQEPEEEARPRPATPPRPTVADPALARSIDLLKALAVVRQTRAD